jgi:multidrug efflux pump subunit AcrB
MEKAAIRARKNLQRRMREKRRLAQVEQVVAAEGKKGAAKKEAVAALVSGETRRKPAEESVARAFGEVIRGIREETRKIVDENGKVVRPAHNSAVDIRLEFRSLDLRQSGLIFRKEQKENSVSLELATRVLPEDESVGG